LASILQDVLVASEKTTMFGYVGGLCFGIAADETDKGSAI
jgi:hypothetical protein